MGNHRNLKTEVYKQLRRHPLPGALLALILVGALFLSGCTTESVASPPQQPLQVSLTVDGETYNLTTEAANVRQLLEEAGVDVIPEDQVSPPPFTVLTDGMAVSVVRIQEEIEVIEESLPFDRRIVRSETMDAGEAPRIIQGGRNGRQEITVRTVYHDGVQVERQRTQVTVLEEPQDEIVMIGVGSTPGAQSFEGMIAFRSGGSAVLLRGSTAFPQQLEVGGQLDGRVFALSPTGSHLLYTRAVSDTGSFNNELWLISTDPGAAPRSLGVENVLWAGWNPARSASLQIAYTTGNSVNQPPGWEANNDLWIATIFDNEDFPFNPQRIVEAYPATYGWWGGNFDWSPDGSAIAYAYADEVGYINLQPPSVDERRVQLYTFTEYNTRSDWVWVPTLTWGPEGRYLAFSSHGGATEEAMEFDIHVADVETGVVLPFVTQAGMWSHPHWSPPQVAADGSASGQSEIAYLQASNPLDGLRSPYYLWLMEQDGSNRRQVYPPPGEISRFPLEGQFMAWSPDGRELAFVFGDALYLFDLAQQEAHRINQDDTAISRPTWAPYGAAIEEEVTPTTQPAITPAPTAEPISGEQTPEE